MIRTYRIVNLFFLQFIWIFFFQIFAITITVSYYIFISQENGRKHCRINFRVVKPSRFASISVLVSLQKINSDTPRRKKKSPFVKGVHENICAQLMVILIKKKHTHTQKSQRIRTSIRNPFSQNLLIVRLKINYKWSVKRFCCRPFRLNGLYSENPFSPNGNKCSVQL